jgi:hypothetical protein
VLTRFEMSNPDNQSKPSLTALLRMVLDQFIACFARHAEAWMSLAAFEGEFSGPSEARAVFREAIDFVPKVLVVEHHARRGHNLYLAIMC